MNFKLSAKKTWATVAIAGVVGIGTTMVSGIVPSANLAQAAAAASSQNNEDAAQALKTLNSFYKPALKGQFPGSVSELTVGKSTRKDVFKAIGEPSEERKNASGYDVYGAEMGHPGYAFTYKSDKIREIRYFGTNIERQTNIGGITMSMLKKNWGAPNTTTTVKNGNSKQTKITYNRDKYKLEFIFNSSTDLDHINLLAK
ncbi:YjgB family protein [Paenibacillus sp. D2_2]|uniref:YjgB family protein n=1 Tax=Paenibacillus sp. D2_2 TaxID=3073092 RepID=UPI00281630E6|nr:YjgB family protein [Paenibacillus sp. D2_2]WMT38990.1 YjgB family protein [Paenibacillus sp. D2_2]